MSRHIRFAGALAALLFLAPFGMAQHQWSGEGGDDSWGTAGNWTNNTSPAAAYTGRVLFAATDLGGTNVLDADRLIAGSANNLAQGLHVVTLSDGRALGHTTDLDGHTLTLNGGTLLVGKGGSNSLAVIRNGTLRLGDTIAASLHVGNKDAKTASGGLTNYSRLAFSGVFDAKALTDLLVGRQPVGNMALADGGVDGALDLTNAAIRSGSAENSLYVAGNLGVGWSGGDTYDPGCIGHIMLPPSLTNLNVGTAYIGFARDALGILDLGPGSSLSNFTVRGDFYLASNSGRGRILNLPAGVNWTIGSPSASKIMRVGTYEHDSKGSARRASTGELAVVSGRFTAYLKSLSVGVNYAGNAGNAYGSLDLGSSVLQIGSEPDKIAVDTLEIGTKTARGAAPAFGLLKIPATVTALEAGTFSIGYYNRSEGRLDIGPDSALRAITVTNAFLIGGGTGRIGTDNGGVFEEYLPAGIQFRVGLSDAVRADFFIARRTAHRSYAGAGFQNFAITNGTFSGFLKKVLIGVNDGDEIAVDSTVGILDLSRADVTAFDVAGDLLVGAVTNLGGWSPFPVLANDKGRGYLRLPACASRVAGGLYVGDTDAESRGEVDLNGTLLALGQRLDINGTGAITCHVYGVSAGIDLESADTNSLAVAPGGRIHLVFHQNADAVSENHWGFRMKGDARAHFADLTNEPARLTWDLGALPSSRQAAFGLFYDASSDTTFAGFEARPQGTLLIVR